MLIDDIRSYRHEVRFRSLENKVSGSEHTPLFAVYVQRMYMRSSLSGYLTLMITMELKTMLLLVIRVPIDRLGVDILLRMLVNSLLLVRPFVQQET
jgi:hypothetical protein